MATALHMSVLTDLRAFVRMPEETPAAPRQECARLRCVVLSLTARCTRAARSDRSNKLRRRTPISVCAGLRTVGAEQPTAPDPRVLLRSGRRITGRRSGVPNELLPVPQRVRATDG